MNSDKAPIQKEIETHLKNLDSKIQKWPENDRPYLEKLAILDLTGWIEKSIQAAISKRLDFELKNSGKKDFLLRHMTSRFSNLERGITALLEEKEASQILRSLKSETEKMDTYKPELAKGFAKDLDRLFDTRGKLAHTFFPPDEFDQSLRPGSPCEILEEYKFLIEKVAVIVTTIESGTNRMKRADS